MDPKFFSPFPIDTERSNHQDADSLKESMTKQLDNDWTVYADYEMDGRAGHLKYSHANFYNRKGNVKTMDHAINRYYQCQLDDVDLGNHATVTILASSVKNINVGNSTVLILRECIDLETITATKKCQIFLENCNIEKLQISKNVQSHITIVDTAKPYQRPSARETKERWSDPYSEARGERIIDYPMKSPNKNDKTDFITENDRCRFRLEGQTMTGDGDNIITKNKDCHFTMIKCTAITAENTWYKNTDSVSKIVGSSFLGNDWIMKEESGHIVRIEGGTSSSVRHGFSGSNYEFTCYDSELGLGGKGFVMQNSEFHAVRSQFGGTKLFLNCSHVRINTEDSKYTGDTHVSTDCANMQWLGQRCQFNSSDTDFDDKDSTYRLIDCELKATNLNMKIQNSNGRFEGTTFDSPTKNVEWTDGNFLSINGNFKSAAKNIEGKFTLFKHEKTTFKAPEGLTIDADTSSFQRCTFDHSGNSLALTGKHADIRETSYEGPADFTNMETITSNEVVFTKPVTYTKVKRISETNITYTKTMDMTKSVSDGRYITAQEPLTFTDCHVDYKFASLTKELTVTGGAMSWYDSSVALAASITNCSTVDLHTVSFANTLAITKVGRYDADGVTVALSMDFTDVTGFSKTTSVGTTLSATNSNIDSSFMTVGAASSYSNCGLVQNINNSYGATLTVTNCGQFIAMKTSVGGPLAVTNTATTNLQGASWPLAAFTACGSVSMSACTGGPIVGIASSFMFHTQSFMATLTGCSFELLNCAATIDATSTEGVSYNSSGSLSNPGSSRALSPSAIYELTHNNILRRT